MFANPFSYNIIIHTYVYITINNCNCLSRPAVDNDRTGIKHSDSERRIIIIIIRTRLVAAVVVLGIVPDNKKKKRKKK